MMKKLIFVFLITNVIINHDLFAQNKSASSIYLDQIATQNKKIDSLLDVIKKTKNDTACIRIYENICAICNDDEGLKYGKLMLALCDKVIRETKDSLSLLLAKQQKIPALRYMSQAYEIGSPEALELFKKSLTMSEELKDLKNVVDFKIVIARWYAAQGDFLKQLDCLKAGLSASKKIDDKKGMARFYRQIQMLYSDQGDTVQVLNYLNKNIQLEKEIGDQKRIARAYFLNGEAYKSIDYYKEAIESFLKSIKVYEQNNDLNPIPQVMTELGKTYTLIKEYKKAHYYLAKANEIARKNNDAENMFMSEITIGETFLYQGNFVEAIAVHKRALKEAEAVRMDGPICIVSKELARDYFGLKDFANAKKYSDRALAIGELFAPKEIRYEILVTAYKIDSASLNYKEAFEHFQKSLLLKAQLNSEEIHKAASREKFQDDLEKQKFALEAEQDKKDALNEEEKAKQRVIIYSISLGLFLVLVLVVFIYRSYKQKQKINSELAIKNQTIEHQKQIVEEKHREITDSINYAERIQRSFLATKEILDENLKNYFVFFQPKDVVSGDFYWASKLNNGHFALVTADSTGHGVPGAIMSLLNIASLEKSVEKEVEPAEILNSTRKIIIERLKKDGSVEGGKDGMDCSLVSFDFEKKTLLYSAAHNPVWIVRQVISSSDKGAYREMINENSSRYEQSSTRTDSKFELIELEPDKMPVGKHDHDARSFSQKSFDLIQGDVIYTLTDGYPDQFGGAKGKKFMYKKLKELFISIASKSMEEQKEILATTFSDWKGDSEQVDDVCVIGVRV